MRQTVYYFDLSPAKDTSALVAALQEPFLATPVTTHRTSISFYDTFDWRLFQAGFALKQLAGAMNLIKLADGQRVNQARQSAASHFMADLLTGSLQAQLMPLLEMRALLKLAEFAVQATTYRVLNDDQKTILRFGIETYALAKNPEQPVLSRFFVRPLKGYPKAARLIMAKLKTVSLQQIAYEAHFKACLAVVGRTPGDYSSKLNLQLHATMPAQDAAKILHQHLLTAIVRNHPYITQDIDTEFLHDFRVAVRRTRSALNQIKGVFAPEATDYFKAKFRDLGQATNALRDLDVYLLAEAQYRAKLPANLQDDLTPLFEYLRQKRTLAWQQTKTDLAGPIYQETIQAWSAFLADEATEAAGPQAEMPIIEVARRRIYKTYQQIIKHGQSILAHTASVGHTEDEELHALRIRCKKLRYLLEFFESLFSPKTIARLVRQLKKLQTNLGDFNDLCVQEAYLQQLAAELPPSPQLRRTLLALGALVQHLGQEQAQVKANFAQTFTKFAAATNQDLYKTLFKRGGPVA